MLKRQQDLRCTKDKFCECLPKCALERKQNPWFSGTHSQIVRATGNKMAIHLRKAVFTGSK